MFAGLVADAPTAIASEADELRELEHAIDESRDRRTVLEEEAVSAQEELAAMRRALIAAAASAQKREAEVSELEYRLTALRAEERAKAAHLRSRRTALASTLGALLRLSRRPPEALIATPTSAVDTVRSSKLLSAVVPTLKGQAEALRAELAAVHRLRTAIASEQDQLGQALTALDGEQRLIRRLLDQKANKSRRAEAEVAAMERQLSQLAAQAEDLRALVSQLAAVTRTPPESPVSQATAPSKAERISFSAARGVMPLPVLGRLVVRFGQINAYGMRSRGVSIEARASAHVIAPHDGHVAFAGIFRSYGQLLIIAHGEGYHTLLAGLDRIECDVGQWVLAGEPVGQMADRARNPVLYVEVRRDGEPVNPLVWLAGSDGKVSG